MLFRVPAWGGFLSAEMINRIDALLKRLKRFGYIHDLISKSDYNTWHRFSYTLQPHHFTCSASTTEG